MSALAPVHWGYNPSVFRILRDDPRQACPGAPEGVPRFGVRRGRQSAGVGAAPAPFKCCPKTISSSPSSGSRMSEDASFRLPAPNLRYAEDRWLFTVLWARNIPRAISLFVLPAIARRSTSRSRCDRSGRAGAFRRGTGRALSPAATAQTAGASVSLELRFEHDRRGARPYGAACGHRAAVGRDDDDRSAPGWRSSRFRSGPTVTGRARSSATMRTSGSRRSRRSGPADRSWRRACSTIRARSVAGGRNLDLQASALSREENAAEAAPLAPSVRTLYREDRRDCTHEELDVPPQRPVRHVEVVEADHLLERDLGAPVDLPRGRSGPGVMPSRRRKRPST